MTINVTKVLAAQQDLAIGKGNVLQNRQGSSVTVAQICLSFIFDTIAEITALDINDYAYASKINTGVLTNYWYDSTSSATADGLTVLLPDGHIGNGRWLLLDVDINGGNIDGVNINGSTINGSTIGASSASTIKGTTIEASGVLKTTNTTQSTSATTGALQSSGGFGCKLDAFIGVRSSTDAGFGFEHYGPTGGGVKGSAIKMSYEGDTGQGVTTRGSIAFKASDAESGSADFVRLMFSARDNMDVDAAGFPTAGMYLIGANNDVVGGLVIGAPTGGAKGVGSLNAQAVYDDNVLLSCFVFDAYLDGTINHVKWDALTPDTIIEAIPEHLVHVKEDKEVKYEHIEIINGKAIVSIKTRIETINTYRQVLRYKEDGSPDMYLVSPPIAATKALYDDEGNEVKAASKAKPAVFTQKTFNDPIMIVKAAVPEKVIKKTHKPMRKFETRLGTEYDPCTLDGYAKHWKDKRHLTAFPNEVNFDPLNQESMGSWVQKFMETHETEAILIELLNKECKAQKELINLLTIKVTALETK